MTPPTRDPAPGASARSARVSGNPLTMLILTLLGFIVVAQALWLPLFGADGVWMGRAGPDQPGQLPALFLAPQAALIAGQAGDDPSAMMRLISIGAHLVLATLIAVIPRGRSRQAALLAMALASPFAYRTITWLPAVGLLLAAMPVATGARLALRGRRAAGGAVATAGAVWLGACLALAPEPLRMLFVASAAWLGFSVAAVFSATALLRRAAIRSSLPARTLVSLTLPVIALSGAFNTAGWLRGYTLALAPIREALLFAAGGPNPARVLLINTPTRLALPNVKSPRPLFDDWLLPVPPARAGFGPYPRLEPVVARTIGDVISTFYALGGVIGQYDGAQMVDRSGVLREAFASQAVIVSSYGANEGEDSAMVFRFVPATSAQLARFESSDGKVTVERASACVDPSGALWVRAVMRSESSGGGTSKLFRHALASPGDDAQIAINDASLMGGFAELADLPIGATFEDVSIFKARRIAATAVRIGIYDWKTGVRWRAVNAAGAPDASLFPGDTLAIPIQRRPECATR